MGLQLEDTVGTNNIIEDDQSGIQDLRKWLLPHDSIEFKVICYIPVGPPVGQLYPLSITFNLAFHPFVQLRNDVEAALEELPPGNRSLSSYQTLASKLTRLGYHVHIRTALGGGDGYECLRNLRHIFLCVEVPAGKPCTPIVHTYTVLCATMHTLVLPAPFIAADKSKSQKLIVDLNFKEQFSIAKSTAYYSQLHECLPEVYVAPEATITPLVNFLCQVSLMHPSLAR